MSEFNEKSNETDIPSNEDPCNEPVFMAETLIEKTSNLCSIIVDKSRRIDRADLSNIVQNINLFLECLPVPEPSEASRPKQSEMMETEAEKSSWDHFACLRKGNTVEQTKSTTPFERSSSYTSDNVDTLLTKLSQMDTGEDKHDVAKQLVNRKLHNRNRFSDKEIERIAPDDQLFIEDVWLERQHEIYQQEYCRHSLHSRSEYHTKWFTIDERDQLAGPYEDEFEAEEKARETASNRIGIPCATYVVQAKSESPKNWKIGRKIRTSTASVNPLLVTPLGEVDNRYANDKNSCNCIREENRKKKTLLSHC